MISTANTKFAFFMTVPSNNIYCKVNELRANLILWEQILQTINTVSDISVFELRKQHGIWAPLIADQRKLAKKIVEKHPEIAQVGGIFTPKSAEQSTRFEIARFKAQLFSGQTAVDLTAGIGSETWEWARQFRQVVAVDSAPDVHECAIFNLQQLQIHNVQRILSSAEKYLENLSKPVDLISLDPDRRPQGKRLTAAPEDYAPNFLQIISKYPHLAKHWVIKLDPLTDIAWLQNQLPQAAIFCIAHKGEMKEVTAVLSPQFDPDIYAIDTAWIQTSIWKEGDEMPLLQPPSGSPPYFVEWNANVIKAGFTHLPFLRKQILPLTQSGIFCYTNSQPHPAFGRSFQLMHAFQGSLREIKKVLKAAGVVKAHVKCREAVLASENLAKKLELEDGGNHYLFATSQQNEWNIWWVKKWE